MRPTEETSYIKTITVTDPDTGGDVEVEIRKCLNSGAMVGIDASFLEQGWGQSTTRTTKACYKYQMTKRRRVAYGTTTLSNSQGCYLNCGLSVLLNANYIQKIHFDQPQYSPK